MRGWFLAVLLAVAIGVSIGASQAASGLSVVAPDVVDLGQPVFVSATGEGVLSIWRDGVQVAGGSGVVFLQENATSPGTITYVVEDDLSQQTVQVTVLSPEVRTVYIGGLPFTIGDSGGLPQGVDPGALSGPVFQSAGSYASQQLNQQNQDLEGYMSTYEKADLPLIVEDGIGTFLAAVVENLPLLIMFVVFSVLFAVLSRVKR